jgi:pantetheine-phosphate adenylyltransferase
VSELTRGVAVCPGTSDPVTFGHLDIIGRAANVFDKVVVAIVDKPVRKGSNTVFSTQEREEFIRAEVKSLENVEIKSFDNLLVEFARENGATAIVKGLRAISDFEYELEMNQLNRSLASDVESIYLMASPQYSFLSSSGVKEIATFGGDVSKLVPEEVARRLKEAFER